MTLELEVRSQRIYRRDRESPVSDSRGYLRCHWEFATRDWDDAVRRVMIITRNDLEPCTLEVDEDGFSAVPDLYLQGEDGKRMELGLAIVGYGEGNLVITTQPIAVRVLASGYLETGPAAQLPPDTAQRIYAEMERLREYVKERGVTYIPSVSENGVLTWTNDGGRPNPEPVDIRGPAGEAGDILELGSDTVLAIWQQFLS